MYNRLICVASNDNYDSGYLNDTYKEIHKCIKNKDLFDTILRICLDRYGDKNIITNILYALGCVEYDEVLEDLFICIPLMFISGECDEIVDLSLRCLEQWDKTEYLKNIKINTKWLDNYRNEIIEDEEKNKNG